MSPHFLDYAIVGAGVSGLYVAWRILDAQRAAHVHLFDCLDDVGGRLLSVPLPGLPFTADAGGMRFKTSHVLLHSAVQRLGLPTRPFDYPLLFGSLRGRNFLPGAIGKCTHCGATNGYFLDANECDASPEFLLLRALLSIIRDVTFDDLARAAADWHGISISKLEKLQNILNERIMAASLPPQPLALFSPREWAFLRQYAQLRGLHLYDYGFEQILTKYLSAEAFQYIRHNLGVEAIASNWNAAEAIIWFLSEFASSELIGVCGGFQEFPRSMSRIVSALGGGLSLRYSLKKISRVPSGPRGQHFVLTFTHGNRPKTVKASNVFLCLPQGALLRIEGLADILEEPALLKAVQPHSLFKIFFGYRDSWWLTDSRVSLSKNAHGKAITDTPLRQIYYFGSEASTRQIKTDSTAPSMLMVSCNDEQSAEFWRTSKGVRRRIYLGDYMPHLSEHEIRLMEDLGMTEPMAEIASKLIENLHPNLKVPKPHVAIYKDWRDAPFYGGWHTWRAGIEPWKIREKLKGLSDDPHICGEAFSSEQGWAEGALKSAELGLEAAGFTERPSWIPKEAFEAQNFNDHANYIRF